MRAAGGADFHHVHDLCVGASSDDDRSAFAHALDGRELDIAVARGGREGQVEGLLGAEIRFVVIRIGAIREAAGAEGGRLRLRTTAEAETASGCRGRGEVAGLVEAGVGLVALGQPGIRYETEVERIGDIALRVAQGDVAARIG